MNNLREKFTKETGLRIMVEDGMGNSFYTEEYVEWLEDKFRNNLTNESKSIKIKNFNDYSKINESNNLDLIDLSEMSEEDIVEFCSEIEDMEESEAKGIFNKYKSDLNMTMYDLEHKIPTWEDLGYNNIQEYIGDLLYKQWERTRK